MRKRIAVLVAQIDETTQNRFLTEFIKQAYTYDYDVCIFSMYQKYQETALRSVGDANIYELVNFELFDAVLMLADTIMTPGLSKKLQERIKNEFDGPVLIIDEESPYFESVMMDHYTPVYQIVNHLIEVHNYKDIAFLGGKEGHPHSVQRLNAFLDCMNKHGLTVRDEWIYHGNYWYDSAEKFAELLLQDREHLPRAIACANDCMAIGVAAKLSENGVKIPEEVAITGYDSLEVGRNSPAPLTSASIPADECGKYSMEWLHAAINHLPVPEFERKAALFIGGSCGCDYKIESAPKNIRQHWRTQHSARSIYSDFNHITEDMLAQRDLRSFLQVLVDYSYQVSEMGKLEICFNDGFLTPNTFFGETAIRQGYTDEVHVALTFNVGSVEGGEIDFDKKYITKELTPELYEERSFPTTFIFNPFYFDDRCFGYSILNDGEKITLYDKNFRVWTRSVMQGMEAFYRQGYMFSLIERIKSEHIRDDLTGLYNYNGFITYARELEKKQESSGKRLNILSIDIKGVKHLNEIYGRNAGERAIAYLANHIQNVVQGDGVCCRMGNDEFLIAILDDDSSSRAQEIFARLDRRAKEYCDHGNEHIMQLNYANILGEPKFPGELEALINQTVSIKNHKKATTKKATRETKELVDEVKLNQLVANILDKNQLTYHYQPIINVKNGSIYGYEALMRYEDGEVNPSQILEAAKYLNRLPEIERLTLLNVTKDVEENIESFGSAKIFINSLPGISISPEVENLFTSSLKRNKGRFIVEFTEESELDDEQLESYKSKYDELGLELAVDDYGAGYSNANNLLRYKPVYVKIDRMLVSEIQDNPQKRHFVKNIIEYAHNNNIIALAEGVSTKEELHECINLGADLIQGFYTGKATREPIKKLPDDIVTDIERSRLQMMSWRPVGEITL